MKKSKIITTSLLIFVIAIIIPIVMNYILIGSVGAKVTGESKDWLSFFGSYLGGVFTAYISFIILSKTINHNIAIISEKNAIRTSFHIGFCKSRYNSFSYN